VAASILGATAHSGAFDPSRSEAIRNWLARYLGPQRPLFGGIALNVSALRADAPNLTNIAHLLQFLSELKARLRGVRGVFLVLDEINGLTDQPEFARFLKGLVDQNALARPPVPLLLMLCGVEERRRELIRKHQPVGRIFDVIRVEPMTDSEMRDFFSNAFSSVGIQVEDAGMQFMLEYSAGFPKVMHLIGNAAYFQDDDRRIDAHDAASAVLTAAREIGDNYVTPQVLRAIRSEAYRSILAKIGGARPVVVSIRRAEVSKGLTASELKKLNNFLQRMKKLQVLRSGDSPGEYLFNSRMTQLFIWLESAERLGRPGAKLGRSERSRQSQ